MNIEVDPKETPEEDEAEGILGLGPEFTLTMKDPAAVAALLDGIKIGLGEAMQKFTQEERDQMAKDISDRYLEQGEYIHLNVHPTTKQMILTDSSVWGFGAEE